MRAYALCPKWLKPSAEVDLRQVLVGLRPALRTELGAPVGDEEFGRWRRRLGLFGVIDRDGFVVLARRPELCRKIMSIDQAPGNHTAHLGYLLGYPSCCVRAAARIGEPNLDAWAGSLTKRGFIGEFAAIDVSGYRAGEALISHIPCSPFCLASLKMAKSFQKVVFRDGIRIGSHACTRRSLFRVSTKRKT